ncbi:MAG TPA: leucine--tRNA ligase [Ktedonobacterales bacterium]|nr:leucine--tRNA ligase [Ktedonobacterales bacterium]
MARSETPTRPERPHARRKREDPPTPQPITTSRKRATRQPAAQPPRAHARPPFYDFAAFEQRWSEEWEARGLYRVDIDHPRKPYYNLMMFPYPSAEGLHVGNVYAFVGSDIHGRWMSMRGYDVFEPMGFDAFGIHSENFAIQRGEHPASLTARNVARFRETQLKRIGNRFDWSHEVNTTDPGYYRWTQWIFTQLFRMGLAVRKTGVVNWCPNDRTVLADEQVINGHCERCGALVERRALPHWALRITHYADSLLDNLDALDWSERVKAAQRNWIGRSYGVEFSLPVAGRVELGVAVFTTRPDTIFGVTFVVLAPEHPLVDEITTPERRGAIAAYRTEAAARRVARQQARDRDVDEPATPPTGVFTGAYAIHPMTGEQVPIWVADYVLMEYGTGAIMAVPAHDERDWAFARAMGLPVRFVVQPVGEISAPDAPYTGEGVLVTSEQYTGQGSREASEAICVWFEESGTGRRMARYHLRDWLISRQRYWGPPVPIIYCPEHGAVPVPEDQLPVRLPDLEDYRPSGTGGSPLARIESFVNTTCPVCGQPATRDTDVMDNFLDSAWYFLRYPSSDDDAHPWNPERTRTWLPVNMYIGGAEHSVLHLLYARFITMAMHDAGLLDFEEPFTHFRAHGIIALAGKKISKSKGNIVNPDDYINTYGADTLRLYLMFMGPYEQGGEFSDKGVAGAVRFLERVWRLGERDLAAGAPSRDAKRALHQVIRKVSDDTAGLRYNTAIADMMRYSGELEERAMFTREEMTTLLRLMAPYAPFISEEIWHRVGEHGSVHEQPWPEVDEAALRADTVAVVAQVNGKTRGVMTLPTGATEAQAFEAAQALEAVRRALRGQPPIRAIYIPDRLINLVTG